MKTINKTPAMIDFFLDKLEDLASADYVSTSAASLIWDMRLAIVEGHPFSISGTWAEYLAKLVQCENDFEPMGIVHCSLGASEFYCKIVSILIQTGRTSMALAELIPHLLWHLDFTESISIEPRGEGIFVKSSPEFEREFDTKIRVTVA